MYLGKRSPAKGDRKSLSIQSISESVIEISSESDEDYTVLRKPIISSSETLIIVKLGTRPIVRARRLSKSQPNLSNLFSHDSGQTLFESNTLPPLNISSSFGSSANIAIAINSMGRGAIRRSDSLLNHLSEPTSTSYVNRNDGPTIVGREVISFANPRR